MSSEAESAMPQFQGQEAALPAPPPPLPAADGPYAQAAPQFQGAQQAHAVQQVVLPKNPALGVILSFFIPGLGSMVNGSGARGGIILAVYAFGWILSLVLIGIPILIGAWIWGLVDGYLSAQRWNQAHGIVS
jgi:TM2 domain-containing membrane protein YozV